MDKSTKNNPLGGITIISLLMISVSSILSLNIFKERPIPFKSNDVWSKITDLASSNYNKDWISLITFEFVTNILLLIFSVCLVVLLLKQSKYFKICLISFFISKTIIITLTFYFQTVIKTLPTPTIHELTGTAFTTLLLVGIWIPYYMLSEKVEETFIY